MTTDHIPVRIHDICHLQELCGPDASDADACDMRDVLVDRELLDWESDYDGGTLICSRQEWDDTLAYVLGNGINVVAVYETLGGIRIPALYVELPEPSFVNGGVHTSGPLSPAEARMLAARLIAEADAAESEAAR